MQRKKGAENYLRIDRVYDISDEDEICACGCELDKIGENVTGKLDILLNKIRVIRHIRHKLPQGLTHSGLLTSILITKFYDALPFYRQEKQFIRLGIDNKASSSKK